jgi:pimeloyl-ACP methyl ester carboxylesterase
MYETAKSKGVDSANQLFLNNIVFSSAREDESVFNCLKEMILSYSGWLWLNKNPIKSLYPTSIQQLNRITVPVLILTGERDISDFQEIANILHKSINHSIKKQISGAGHMSNMEQPYAFNSLVYQFLSQGK